MIMPWFFRLIAPFMFCWTGTSAIFSLSKGHMGDAAFDLIGVFMMYRISMFWWTYGTERD